MRYPTDQTLVRYIKLGEGNTDRDKRCNERGIAFMHFGTDKEGMFEMCRSRDWPGLREEFRKQQGKVDGVATNLANQFKAFVEDPGDVLWFTFFAGRLWWGFLTPDLPDGPDPEFGYTRRVDGGWRCTGRPVASAPDGLSLAVDDLSGRITKTAGFRGTSCTLQGDDRLYLLNRINGTSPKAVLDAVAARETLRLALVAVIRLLTPQDFELLTEHVFTSAGWRRISATGKVMEVVDIVLEQPLDTSRRIFAQVKSTTSQAEFATYIGAFEQRRDQYEVMYFVYHTASGELHVPDGTSGVVLMGPDQIADKVIDAGVVSWLIEKAR